MVYHSDRQYLHHSLLHAIIDFLSQGDENFCHHLHQKNLDVPFWQIYQYLELCSLPVLYCTATAVLHVLHGNASVVTCVASMKYCLSLRVRKTLK